MGISFSGTAKGRAADGPIGGWAMTERVVDLSCGGRLRIFRAGDAFTIHFDVLRLAEFGQAGLCLALSVSEAVRFRDALGDLLFAERSQATEDTRYP